ncbi:PKD domain-containing protein [Candidatus Falkowbacteria bacterium]|jgi:hypothetical protein|nr:PKD domain-containing protein [Candidatus Falkowbacteria bacterium]MBT4433375.1 PKD domain-containing protein [Candidatus Falkowbacteria bacterium]
MKYFSSKLAFLILLSLAFFILGQNCLAAGSLDITIIEIGAYKKSGYEYVKIYNNTGEDINLEDWKFVEGFSDSKPDGTKHSLKEYNNGFILPSQNEAVICQGPIKFLEEESFSGLILDSSWGSLHESGEKLRLLDSDGDIVEDFTYLPCGEGALKRINFSLADYTSANWQENSEASQDDNSTSSSDESSDNQTDDSSSTDVSTENFIIINEILPNPEGADNEKEFIELKNIGKTTINLENWKLNDNSARTYIIKEKYFTQTFIRPNQFFVIYRNKSKIALNNSGGDEVKLYNKAGKLIDKLSYNEKAGEEKSYARDENNNWSWSPTPTPGKENIILEKNENPVGVIDSAPEAKVNEKIYFDGSDSYDPDGDELFFIWNFGDNNSSTLINPVHYYEAPGEYEISLLIFDSRNASSTAYFSINILGDMTTATHLETKFPSILITEVFANEAGRDENEFIEIFNPNNEGVNLSNWEIEDNTKKAWKIPSNTIIEAKSYLVFYKEETKLTLNNNYDSLKLIDPVGKIISQVSYENAEEEISYSLDIDKNEWSWSYEITPEEENQITEFYKFDSYASPDFSSFENFPLNISLEEIDNLPLGETVEITGVVIVEPGILGKQIFYLNGIQIYMYKKDFPELETGDQIKVIGELGESRGEKRIKIKNKEDIMVLEKNTNLEIPEININEASEEFEGCLVTINGEIVEQKSNILWLDDGSNELNVYVHKYTDIKLDKVSEGQFAKITGIIKRTENGFRLFPRYASDIKLGKILGATAQASEKNKHPPSVKEEGYSKYLYITILGIIIILGNLIWKRRQKIT